MINYPVGATWKCTDKFGRIGYITLNRMHGSIQVWHYGYSYSDGSGHKFDWAPSRNLAKKNHFVSGTFKRVK